MASWTIKGIRTVEGQPQTVNIAVVKDLELHDEWMAECYITVSVKSADPIEFAVGDWIDYRGERYTIQYDPNVLKKARRGTYGEGFTYDNIKFVGLQDEVVRCDFNDVVLSDNDTHYTALPTFPFFCNDVDDLLDRIQANLEGLYPGSWIVIGLNTVRNNSRGTAVGRASAFYNAYKQYVDPTGAARTDPYGNQGIAESVDNITCWDALKKVHDDFDLNFIIRGRVIVVGTAGVFTANTFQYGKGNGLYEIERIGESDQRIVTRLRAYGSEDNLPSRYYADINLLPYGTNTAAGTGIANLDVDFNASYFTNEFESGQVAVVAKIGNTTYSNAVAYNNAETGKIIINTGTTDAIAVDAKVYITDGVKRDMWPSDHRDIAQGALPDNMAVSRLMLPGFPNQSLDAWVTAHKNLTGYEWLLQAVNDGFTFSTDPHRPYIDSPNKDIYGIRPGNIYFDGSNDTENIHPTIEGLSPLDEVYAAEQISDNGVFDQGGEVPNFKITLPNLGFDLKKYYQDGASIDLKNGMCGARSFKMAGKPEQDENNRWVCDVEREYDQSLDLWFPYNDFQIHGSSVYGTGDKYALIGIYLPDAYIETAAVKLLQASIEALKKNHAPRYTYQPRIDELWMQRQHDTAIASQGVASLHDTLKAGDIFSFADADLNINASIIIDVLTIREHGNNGIPTYEITLRDEKQVGTIEKIANKVDSVFSAAVNGAYGGSGGGMTVSQIQSLINRFGDERYLSKLNDDTARGFITFLKGLQIGNAFTPGLLGEGGVLRKENDGKIYLELDKMYVRMKAYFDTVEIREYRHTEGNRVASVAGNKCVRVEWYNSSNEELEQTSANLSSVAYFRCFFRASDGDDTVRNNFVIGDQVYCHIVSVAGENDDPSQKGMNQKHYWRLCIGRNTEGNLTTDGEAWIDVSNRSSETLVIGGTSYTHAGYQSGSDVPSPQDSMVQLGNINDTDRQGAVIEYVTGGDAPAYQIYQGINDFALTGKSMIFLGYNSQSGHADLKVYGDAYIGDRNQTTFIKYEQENATTHAPKLQIKAEVIFQNPENPSQTTTIQDFANAVTGDIADLQSQIDGEIDTWFYDYLPIDPDAVDPRAPLIWNDQAQTEPCHPYYDWYVADGGGTAEEVTTERTKHLGDIFYDNSTGYAFRFALDELTGDFIWTEITDSAVIKALENATKAQDTADSKRRVFVAQPAPVAPKNYVEYDIGDLWVNATYPSGYTGETDESQHKYKNDYLRCITAKPIRNAQGEITDGNFSINDWQLASKYTDDAKFNGYINQILNGTGATGDSATVANAIRAIKGALNEGTLIDGGLVLTSLIGLRSNNVLWSGISGQYDPWTETHAKGHGIAAWYGGGMVDIEDMSSSEYTTWKTAWDAMTDDQKAASSTVAKSLFRFDGSGYLATANITWNASGAVTIKNIISLTDTDNHNVSLNDLTKLTSIFHTETYGSGNVTELLVNPQNAFSQLFINRTGTPVTNYPADLHTITDYSVLNFAEMKARFITVEFFEALFELHSGDTGNPKINANSDLSAYTSTQKALFNIKAMFGLWTEKYLSVLGYNNSGGGGGGTGDVTWDLLASSSDTRPIAHSHLSEALANYALTAQIPTNNNQLSNGAGYITSSALNGYATQLWVTTQGYSTPSSVSQQMQTYANLTNGVITIGDNSITPITSVSGTIWGKSFTNGGTISGTISAGNNGGAIEKFHSIELNSAGTLSNYGGFIDFHFYDSNASFVSTADYTTRIIESEVGVISILAKNNDATNASRLAGLIVGASYDGSYVQIGNVRLVYDSNNNALKVVGSNGTSSANFYATGSVSALGYGAGGGGGTGDVTWDLLADNTDTRQIAQSHLTTALTNYALTSQLAGYLPLTAGSSYPLTGALTINTTSNFPLILKGATGTSSCVDIRFLDRNGNHLGDIGYSLYTSEKVAYISYNAGTGVGIFCVDDANCYFGSNFRQYTIYHTGNLTSAELISILGYTPANSTSLGNYLPLTAGSSYPLTGALTINVNDAYPLTIRGAYQYVLIHLLDRSNNHVSDIGYTSYYNCIYLSMNDTTTPSAFSFDHNGCYYTQTATSDQTTGLKQYTIYHSGNLTSSQIATILGYTPADATSLGSYLPLTAGVNRPLTGRLYINNASDEYQMQLKGTTDGCIIRFCNTVDDYYSAAEVGWFDRAATVGNTSIAYIANTNSYAIFSIDHNGCYYTDDSTIRKYTIYHTGNISSASVASAAALTTARTFWGQSFDGTSNVDGCLSVTGTAGFREGIRIHSYGGYTTLILCGTDNTGDTGTSANSWSMHTYNGDFYLNKAGSTSHTGNEFVNVSGNWGIGVISPSYKLHVDGTVCATSLMKSGGTSTQFLKADGSVDGNTYALASALANYLPLAGGTMTGQLTINSNTAYPLTLRGASSYTDIHYLNSSGTHVADVGFQNSDKAFYISNNATSGRYSIFSLYIDGCYFTDNSTFKKYTIIHSGIIGNYNAGSATILQTARNIWGKSFNGSADITGTIEAGSSGGAIEGFHSWELNTHNTAGTNIGGFLDFHYNGTAQDYSVRLIEKDYSGVLQILAKDTGTGNAQRAGLIVGAGTYTSFVQIGNGRIVWNDSDHALRIVDADGNACNLYATGGISALGYQSGGGGGGTGVFSTNITPDTTGTYDIGTSTYKWRNIYLCGASDGSKGFSIITNYSGYTYIGSVQKVRFGCNVDFDDWIHVENRIEIGGDNSNYDLYVSGENGGDAYFLGNVSVASLTNRSDMRLKDIVGDVNLSVQQIASAPTFKFRFKEKAKRTMVGTSAQYWDAVLPESVTRDADGILGLDYGVTALVSTIILAKGMTEHERRITKLEMENAELRARIKDLEER